MADEHDGQHGGGEHAESHGGGGGHGGHGGGHGGGGHEEHEGAPEWLISFADNVALMMGFFVILLAMNMQKPSLGGIGGEGKFPSNTTPEMEDFAIAIREAFNHPVDINSTNPNEAALVRRLRERSEEGGQTRAPGISGDKRDVQAPRTTDWYRPAGAITFNDLDAGLSEESKATLAEIADKFKGENWIIEVRGHVSAQEARNGADRAVRLAFDRAYAASRELIAEGLKPEQIRVVSCSDNERFTARASSAEAHRSNQRVEIFQTQEPVAGDPYNGPGR